MALTSERSPPDEAMEQHVQETDDPPSHKYKSFKKKYNKMRHIFKEKMNMSNALFAEEQKAIKVTRRLQEQNDQLLDLLLQANKSTRVPSHLHYDLRSATPSESAVPALEPDTNTHPHHSRNSALAALEEAKQELSSGQITPNTYAQLESAFHPVLHRPISLTQLSSSTLHTVLKDLPLEYIPEDIAESSPLCYLSLSHEEEYLSALDAALAGSTRAAADSHPIRSNEREKEVQLRNPVSVYNWLRKHQPQVFLQDSDSSPDKPAAKAPSSSKPARRSAVAPKQEEVIDDDGMLLGAVEGPTRSKRKREDEPYRPKGGSSRPSKRKKGGAGDKGRDTGDDEGL